MKARTIAAGSAVLIIAILGGTYALTLRGSEGLAACTAGAVAGGEIGGPFELVNEAGETVTDTDVITEPTLVYFGYTFCPDVCPLDTMRNGQALDILAERDVDAKGLFISVDPARDTPEVLASFTDNFHSDMEGLTGSPEQVDAAAKEYRVLYEAQTDEDPDYYLVDHTVFTYLMLPETGFIDFFDRDATPTQIADTVQCVVETGAN